MNNICGVKNIPEQEKKDLWAQFLEGGVRYVDPLFDCAVSEPRSANQIMAGLDFQGTLIVFDKSRSDSRG